MSEYDEDQELIERLRGRLERQIEITYEAKEVARKALDFCQIVCPPSPGQHGTYDAEMGRTFRELLNKDREHLEAKNAELKKVNHGLRGLVDTVLDANEHNGHDDFGGAQRRLMIPASWFKTAERLVE